MVTVGPCNCLVGAGVVPPLHGRTAHPSTRLHGTPAQSMGRTRVAASTDGAVAARTKRRTVARKRERGRRGTRTGSLARSLACARVRGTESESESKKEVLLMYSTGQAQRQLTCGVWRRGGGSRGGVARPSYTTRWPPPRPRGCFWGRGAPGRARARARARECACDARANASLTGAGAA